MAGLNFGVTKRSEASGEKSEYVMITSTSWASKHIYIEAANWPNNVYTTWEAWQDFIDGVKNGEFDLPTAPPE